MLNVWVAVQLLGVPSADPWIVTSMWCYPSATEYISASAPVTQVCAAGYSGWLGVVSSGVQLGSGWVAGFPSICAFRIAMIGRQNR